MVQAIHGYGYGYGYGPILMIYDDESLKSRFFHKIPEKKGVEGGKGFENFN
jgi:hypothetical protein